MISVILLSSALDVFLPALMCFCARSPRAFSLSFIKVFLCESMWHKPGNEKVTMPETKTQPISLAVSHLT